MIIIPPEVCSWICVSVVGQLAVIGTFLLTIWQELRYQKNKDKIKVIREKK